MSKISKNQVAPLHVQALITNFFKVNNESIVKTSRQFKEIKKKSSPNLKSEKKISLAFLAKQRRSFYKKYGNQFQNVDRKKSWHNYLFFATNNFREYTVITMIPIRGKKICYDANFDVATASVDDDDALTSISVKPEFQRQKIGKELIRFINKCCPQLQVYGGTENNSRYRLTTEGAALIRSCVQKGILNTEQVIANEVPGSPGHSFF